MAGNAAAGAQAHPESAAGTSTTTVGATKTGAAATETAQGTAAAKSEATPGDGSGAEKPGAQGTTSTEPGGTAAKATEPEAKATEKYALQVPDAGKAYVDDADLKYLEDVARQSGWSNDDAQAALEEHVATVTAQSDRYRAETMADKEYGGDKFVDTQRLVQAALDRIRPAGHPRHESFRRFMGRGGAGNHIEVVSFLADLGRLMGEDSPAHARSAGAGGGKDAAAVLYDNPTSVALDKSRGA